MLRRAILVCVLAALAAATHHVVYRPCRLNHLDCIRAVLSDRSQCDDENCSGLGSTYIEPCFRYETPYFNATYVETNLITRYINKCYFSEFYINQRTDSLVVTIDCPNMVFESLRTVYQHYSAREDETYCYNFTGTYPLVRYTTVMKNLLSLDFCNSYTYAEVTALPVFNVNPNDQETANFLTVDLTDLFVYERETFAYRGAHIFRLFINNFICNFGCS